MWIPIVLTVAQLVVTVITLLFTLLTIFGASFGDTPTSLVYNLATLGSPLVAVGTGIAGIALLLWTPDSLWTHAVLAINAFAAIMSQAISLAGGKFAAFNNGILRFVFDDMGLAIVASVLCVTAARQAAYHGVRANRSWRRVAPARKLSLFRESYWFIGTLLVLTVGLNVASAAIKAEESQAKSLRAPSGLVELVAALMWCGLGGTYLMLGWGPRATTAAWPHVAHAVIGALATCAQMLALSVALDAPLRGERVDVRLTTMAAAAATTAVVASLLEDNIVLKAQGRRK